VAPDVPITVIPNGVDLPTYQHFSGTPVYHDILFTGKMDFRPNVDAVLWFGEQVLPLIQRERPGTTFAVVGQRPHSRLDGLRDMPGVTISGFVPDVRPYIAGTTVYVAPLRVGGGTRLKLLEAMVMGKAIVATSVGAEGFPVVDGQELVLADEPELFAEEVLDLLTNPVRRERLARTGQAFARASYSWDVLVPQLERVYRGCLQQNNHPL
jgi:glycosyltransferase involved in cell wall biosynthesis